MSNEVEPVDIDLVQAIYAQAVAHAIGERKGSISFEVMLAQSVAAAQVMNKALRMRQNDGQDVWLRSLAG